MREKDVYKLIDDGKLTPALLSYLDHEKHVLTVRDFNKYMRYMRNCGEGLIPISDDLAIAIKELMDAE